MRKSLLLNCVWICSTVVRAEQFCSLTVHVVDPIQERRLSDVLVGVHETNGRSFAVFTKDGMAKFCGLGLSRVNVTVGIDKRQCMTEVREIPMAWSVPVEVKIVYDFRPCAYAPGDVGTSGTRPFFCKILLRVFDDEGHPIEGVSLKSSKEMSGEMASDMYGRLMWTYRSDGDLHPVTDIINYIPQRVDLNCPFGGHQEERILILQCAQCGFNK